MPRDTTSALDAELAKIVTRVGYLLQINGSETRRWCNLGDVEWLGVPWISVDFDVQNLRFDAERDATWQLVVDNLDSAVAAWFLLEQMADVTVDLYQFAAGALADDDVVQLTRSVFDSTQIKLDSLQASMVAESSLYAYGPRRRIDIPNGFNFALPQGTQIAWGNEIYIVERTDTPNNG